MGESVWKAGPTCPHCGEPWLRQTALTGRFRCVSCFHRFELRSVCPDCGEHSTFARMTRTTAPECGHCGASLLTEV